MNNILRDAKRVKTNVNRAKSLVPVGKEKDGGEKSPEIAISGRKAESKFITSFVSRIGKQPVNCDYFAYSELNDFGCWIVADGFDEERGGEEAAKIVSEDIIAQFLSKPKFSRRYLKKLITKAHKKLEEIRERSREKRAMSASIVIFLTDYTSMIYGAVGNARLYLIRDDIVREKSRDDSIAHLVYEANQLDYKEIRFHSQRNKLTQNMGEPDGISPEISKKIQLYDGDRILLMSHGAWENLDESEIEVELSKTDSVGKWIGSLEDRIKENSSNNVPNYTLAGIFINEVSPSGKKKFKFNYVKYLIILLIILVIGFLLYRGYSLKRTRDITYERAYTYEEEGLKAVAEGDFEQALTSFELSKNEYNALEISPKDANIVYRTIFSPKITNINLGKQILLVDKKIEQIGFLQGILEDLNEGDKLYNNNNFLEAEEKYKEGKAKIPQLKDLKYNKIDDISKKLDESIMASKALAVAYDMKTEADMMVQDNDVEGAIRNYLEAKIIFLKYSKIDLLTEVTEKAERLAKVRNRKYDTALMYEKRAYEMEATDINGAIVYLEMAKGIYSELRDEARRIETTEKILRLDEMRKTLVQESRAYLNEAKAYADSGEYERALSIIKKSQDISVQLKDNQKMADAMQTEADLFFKNEKYQLSYEKYQEAYGIAADTNNAVQQEYLKGKIDTMKNMLETKKLETSGDTLFSNKKYKEARKVYKEVIEKYKPLEGNKYFEKENYDKLMEAVVKKEKEAWKESNWIPFF